MNRDTEFRDWVHEHRPILLRTAVLLTAGDAHSAEDVVQTALTRLYLAWSKARAAENRLAYARKVVTNVFLDETKKAWRRRESSFDAVPDVVVSHDADPDDTTVLLYQALAELPDRMRAVVVLRYFHEMDVAETSRAMRCTQGTVKSQTSRALTKLRERLGPLLAEPEEGAVAPAELVEHVPTVSISIVTAPRSNA